MRRRGPRGAHQTPASLRAAGVSAFGGVVRAIALAGLSALGVSCAEPAVIETGDGSFELDATAQVHEIVIERLEGAEMFRPSAVAVRRGDVVRYTSHTLDSHAIAFQRARLTSDQQRFLAETGQETSLPILAEGDAWILSLEDAPAGVYPFVCLIHESGGTVEVTQP